MQTHHQSQHTTNMHIPPGMRLEIERIIDQRISQVHVTRHDFTELKNIVASLGQDVRALTEAQKQTDQRRGIGTVELLTSSPPSATKLLIPPSSPQTKEQTMSRSARLLRSEKHTVYPS